MHVAVVTPYYKESRAWVQRCLDSVRAQTRACEHIVVADGHPQDWIDTAGVRHIRLDRAHGDYGNTPRSIGAQLALSEGYDAVAFLDADNWYEPDHLEACITAAEASGADYVAARRNWVREDGSRMPYESDEDRRGTHVDTNCFFLTFGAFHTLARWLMMPKPMAMLGDRFFLASLREDGLCGAKTSRPTVNYLCTWAHVFREIGEEPPASAKDGLPTAKLRRWVGQLQNEDFRQIKRLAGCDLQALLDMRPSPG
ncbi:glycosyltransferase family 2 protein [Rubrivivax gelatinosus]|uniref:Glycosyltransferase 2-like domain-containing protein n=1 Tax=Rubrivivax gelatinosus (strain NBRC 100245 / IL144) TaxID=983917 RepID=I0HPV0_RUBGI|nr:glycosyltransferase family 2 protein [Rubrivivax gelatinosus]BAL95037.1 hypothetical protein RGE_16960 [Rubrivivax gelatinosus IL144]